MIRACATAPDRENGIALVKAGGRGVETPNCRKLGQQSLRPGGMRACPAGLPVKAHAPVCTQVSNIRLRPSPREDIGATREPKASASYPNGVITMLGLG